MLTLCLLSLTLFSGCAAKKELVVPELTIFQKMDVATPPKSLELTALPPKGKAVALQTPDGIMGAYSPDELQKHTAYVAALKGNHEAATQLITLIKFQQQERVALIEAGRGVEREANYLNRRLAQTKQDLDEEKWQHSVDNFMNRLISLGLGVLLIL